MERVVQWYPGHMAKAMRRIGEYLKLVDIVVEVVDARVPRSGRNPALDRMVGKRAHLLVMTRDDLADATATKAWIRAFARRDLEAFGVDGRSQPSVARVAAAMAQSARRRDGTARAIVVGIPNWGNLRSSTRCCGVPRPRPRTAPASRGNYSGSGWRPASN